MPAQRQTNQHSHTAHLCEVRDTDDTLYPAVAVDPGESIDWPHPIAGFTGWDWAAHYAEQAAAASLDAPAAEPGEDDEPAPAAGSGKSRAKAAKASDTTEATA